MTYPNSVPIFFALVAIILMCLGAASAARYRRRESLASGESNAERDRDLLLAANASAARILIVTGAVELMLAVGAEVVLGGSSDSGSVAIFAYSEVTTTILMLVALAASAFGRPR